MNSRADQLVDEYLQRLDAELSDLPRARRRELVEEIAEHIAEARAVLPTQGEAEIRTLLDRLGDPADIAAEARGRAPVPRRRAGALEVAALILLLAGGVVVPVVGWFAGVALLWITDAWSVRDKVVGTLVVPGGLAPALYLAVFGAYTEACSQFVDPVTGAQPPTCVGGPSDTMQILGPIILVLLVLAPLATTVYLGRRLRRQQVPVAA
jgi:hypothetical protein